MKMTVALVLAMVTLVPLSATATPLTITSGTIEFTSAHGTEALFGGDGFFVFAFEEPGAGTSIHLAFGVDPFVTPVGFGTFAGVSFGGQEVCRSRHLEFSCGGISLTSPGFAMPVDWPIGMPFVATVPFTAAGFLIGPGDARFDLVGSGTVTGTCLHQPSESCFRAFTEDSSLVYTFTVAEPPTLLLTLAFAITVVGIAFVHRRAAANN